MGDNSYDRLSSEKIIKTLDKLLLRIEDRFADRGIVEVCRWLVEIGTYVKHESLELNRPQWGLRSFVSLVLLAGMMIILYVGTVVNFSSLSTEASSFVSLVEQGVNIAMLLSIGLAFLVSMETRYKRRRALKDLHQLRSVVHVIDMHQLTKDPSVFLADRTATSHSPQETFTRFEMVRYLDYCSEMLSLTAKLAALYAQNMDDSVVVNAVSDLETLATSLSSKIWQKIAILEHGHKTA